MAEQGMRGVVQGYTTKEECSLPLVFSPYVLIISVLTQSMSCTVVARIVWTRQSREDLESIRAFIARDAPHTADAYIAKLTYGNYRIIYRAGDQLVEVLTVYHSARLLDEDTVFGGE